MAERTWTCQRVTAGEKCRFVNPRRKQLCGRCGKKRPPTRKPKHMVALEIPYERYVELNGGPACGICGKAPEPGKRLDRDHDHRSGEPRGLLCGIPCNKFLYPVMTADWLRAAASYLDRHAERMRLAEQESDAA